MSRIWLLLALLPCAHAQDLQPASSAKTDEGIVYFDPEKYKSVQAAIGAACTGKKPGRVIIPAGIFQDSIFAFPSHCIVSGAGMGETTLRATDSQSEPVVTIRNSTDVRLKDLSIDGNRSQNPHFFDAILLSSASNVVLDNLGIHDANQNGLKLQGAVNYVTLQNSDLYRNGPALPRQASGVVLDPEAEEISHVEILHNRIHDNNLGAVIFNSFTPTRNVEDVSVAENAFYSNANDGFLVNTNVPLRQGSVIGVRIENNESYCNGWYEVDFSPTCRPGFLQRGTTYSSSGVGFDLIGSLITQATIIGNRAHDNNDSGISIDGRVFSKATTSGSTVSWVSGAMFNTNWRRLQAIVIGGRQYLISTVRSSKSLSTESPVGVQKSVSLTGSSVTNDTIVGNQAYSNGTVGIYDDSADSNSFNANIAIRNHLNGFGCNSSSFLTYSGDEAISNNVGSSISNQGFVVNGCLATSLIGIVTLDPEASPSQIYGVLISATANNTMIQSPSIYGAGGGSALNDFGSATMYNDGTRYATTLKILNLRTGVIANNDLDGELTSSGGTSSYIFKGRYASHPICVANDETAVDPVKVAYKDNTSVTFSTLGDADVISYHCIGRN